MRLQLNFAGGNYDFVRPLADGTVRPDGIDLNVLSGMGSGERHHRMGRGQEFDICEFNAAAYLAARDQDFPWTALPVFLHRRFRHGFVFVNTAKGIAAPPDLRGKRIGGPTFLAAGNVWMRGILQEHHGVPHRDVTWLVERDDAVNFTPPAGLWVERVPDGVRAEKMMLDGELDAILTPDLPHAFLAGDKRIARLFADNKEREVAYFKQTGIFPIMHVTLIKQEIVDRHPWVATNLMKAFNQAKEHAYRRILNPRNVALAWVRNALEEQLAVLGNDPWEFGLTPRNRNTLETLQRYCAQQGIVRRERPLEELFVDAGRVSIPEEF
jgi:4,5-dihydroxyphthalate decarboxylase